MAKLLLIDDEPIIHEVFEELLRNENVDITGCYTGESGLEAYKTQDWDLVLLDIMLPDIPGDELLVKLRSINSLVPIIMITAYGTVNSAVQALKQGAFDYITKPFHNEVVLNAIHRALQYRTVLIENARLKDEIETTYEFENIIGKSQKMQEVYELIHRVASSKSTVLLIGESGTGKELVARAIHQKSTRSEKPFVVVTCSNIPAELLESELFGYEKGAFTGASRTKPGLLEYANGGTVFLDEISTMPPSTQAKLLRVLQEREFKRLGGFEPIQVDIRFIAATNEDLQQLVESGRFREDLFFRLNVISIHLPPLRERLEDIPILARHFVRKYALENDKPELTISDKALLALMAYDWPGNVRELEHVIERAVVLTSHDTIDIDDLPANIVEYYYQTEKSTVSLTQKPSFKDRVDAFKRALILEALKEAGGVQKKAAEILKIKPTTLHEMMKRYGIKM